MLTVSKINSIIESYIKVKIITLLLKKQIAVLDEREMRNEFS